MTVRFAAWSRGCVATSRAQCMKGHPPLWERPCLLNMEPRRSVGVCVGVIMACVNVRVIESHRKSQVASLGYPSTHRSPKRRPHAHYDTQRAMPRPDRVAITPDIVRHRFEKKSTKKKQAKVVSALINKEDAEEIEYDEEEAKLLIEDQCTQCHELDTMDDFEPKTEEGWREVVTLMIEEEGAELSPIDAQLVVRYLTENYKN